METVLRALTYVLCVAAFAGAVFAVIGGAAKHWSRPIDRESPPAPVGAARVEDLDQPTRAIYGVDNIT